MHNNHDKADEEKQAEHNDLIESMRMDIEESESARRQL